MFPRRLFAALVAVTLLVPLGGCGFGLDDDGPAVKKISAKPKKTRKPVVKANYTRVGDNSPHDGVARAHEFPIHGIDVSRYQSDIDWERVRANNIRFTVIKATEGEDYLDPKFAENWRGAQRAGVARAAYHFMYWCSTAASQAEWFIRNVPADPDAMPPIIDAEWNSHSRTCTKRADPEDALAKIKIVSDMFEQHYGKKPIIYTDINFHRDVLEDVSLANSFWLRSVAAEPHEKYPGRRWLMWQWTQTGTVPGITSEVDRNVFYGNESAWQSFLQTGCDPRDAAQYARCAPTYTASVKPPPVPQPVVTAAADPIPPIPDDQAPLDPLAAAFFDQ